MARISVSLKAGVNSGDDRPDLDFTEAPKQGQSAELVPGNSWFPCRLLDMTERGVLFVCNKTLAVGKILDLRLELNPGNLVECKVEIKHANETGIGAKIVKIDEESMRLCKLFLQEHHSNRLIRKTVKKSR